LDIICAKCGKHFSSIEAAREHRGLCKGDKNLSFHKITPNENLKVKTSTTKCRICGEDSLFYDNKTQWYICLNKNCRATGPTPEAVHSFNEILETTFSIDGEQEDSYTTKDSNHSVVEKEVQSDDIVHLSTCPLCSHKSFYYDKSSGLYKCTFRGCLAAGKTPDSLSRAQKISSKESKPQKQNRTAKSSNNVKPMKRWKPPDLSFLNNTMALLHLMWRPSKIIILLVALIGTTIIIAVSVAGLISQEIILTVGIGIIIVGVILALQLTKLIPDRRLGFARFFMTSLFVIVFLTVTCIYLEVRSPQDIEDYFTNALAISSHQKIEEISNGDGGDELDDKTPEDATPNEGDIQDEQFIDVIRLEQIEQYILDSINAERGSLDLNALDFDESLYNIAYDYSLEMIKSGTLIEIIIPDYEMNVFIGKIDDSGVIQQCLSCWYTSSGSHNVILTESLKCAVAALEKDGQIYITCLVK
jgi:hypothetical protein